MSERLNLPKRQLIYIYFPYSKAKIYDKPHQDKTEPDQFYWNLIYSNVLGSYLTSGLEIEDYVTCLDDYDKTSKVVLFLSKDGVLSAFDLFWKYNHFIEARIWHLCTNGEGEYDSHTFQNYWEEHDII